MTGINPRSVPRENNKPEPESTVTDRPPAATEVKLEKKDEPEHSTASKQEGFPGA